MPESTQKFLGLSGKTLQSSGSTQAVKRHQNNTNTLRKTASNKKCKQRIRRQSSPETIESHSTIVPTLHLSTSQGTLAFPRLPKHIQTKSRKIRRHLQKSPSAPTMPTRNGAVHLAQRWLQDAEKLSPGTAVNLNRVQERNTKLKKQKIL